MTVSTLLAQAESINERTYLENNVKGYMESILEEYDSEHDNLMDCIHDTLYQPKEQIYPIFHHNVLKASPNSNHFFESNDFNKSDFKDFKDFSDFMGQCVKAALTQDVIEMLQTNCPELF